MRNYPTTKKDIDLAEKLFNLDMSMLEGDSVRTQPAEAVDDIITIPMEILQFYTSL